MPVSLHEEATALIKINYAEALETIEKCFGDLLDSVMVTALAELKLTL